MGIIINESKMLNTLLKIGEWDLSLSSEVGNSINVFGLYNKVLVWKE
jgi:hypothetical protein